MVSPSSGSEDSLRLHTCCLCQVPLGGCENDEEDLEGLMGAIVGDMVAEVGRSWRGARCSI